MKVKSNLSYVYRTIVPDITLMPGLNFIDDEFKESFLKTPGVKNRIDNKLIEVVHETGSLDDLVGSKNLLKDIPLILDIALLNKIKEQDKRPSIGKAIDAQLEKLREGRKEDAA